jgi:hypothetical protein
VLQHDLVRRRYVSAIVPPGHSGVGDELVVEGFELGIARRFDLSAQPREQEAAPVGEIRDLRRQTIWVQRDPERVRRRCPELGCDTAVDIGDAAVRGDDVPVAVDHYCRIGLVRGQKPLERLPDGRHLVFVE